MQVDLNDDETAALARLLTNTIDADRYPLARPDVERILGKIRPESVREPLPPQRRYERRARVRQDGAPGANV